MHRAVKLSEEIVAHAEGEARIMRRSIGGQVEYWAELGRTVEAAGLLDYPRVRAALRGDASVHGFKPADTKLYLELLGDELEDLDGSDTRRIRRLEALGHPTAGEDEDGKLVVRPGRAGR